MQKQHIVYRITIICTFYYTKLAETIKKNQPYSQLYKKKEASKLPFFPKVSHPPCASAHGAASYCRAPHIRLAPEAA